MNPILAIIQNYLYFLLFQSNFGPLNVNSTGFDFQFNLNSQSIFIILSMTFEKVNKTGESCFNDLSKSQRINVSVKFNSPLTTTLLRDDFVAQACMLECPRLWQIMKNSLHNEGIYKGVNSAPIFFV